MSPARLPRAAWLAIGIAGGSAAQQLGAPPTASLAVGLLLLAAALAAREGRWAHLPGTGHGIARATAALGLGVALVAIRVIVAPPGMPTPPLSGAGPAPWTAEVVSVGSPKEGAQLVRLALGPPGQPVLVAATLPAFPAVAAGAVIRVEGRLEPPPADDPYGEYLRRTGASGTLRATAVELVRAPPWPSVQGARDGAGDALRLALPEPEAGLAAGILIGLRERVDRALAADFATAGVSHVVAISGWNIAIVASLVGVLLRRRPRGVVAVTTGLVVAAYVVAAGASPSVLRAAVMAGVVLLARTSGRAVRAAAALALACSGLLIADPTLVADAGFRLSVLATAGLLAWANPIAAWLGRILGGRIPGWLAEALGISLAAQAATLPDVLATFGRLSLVAPAVNLVVVPIVPAAMACGAVALLGGWAVMLGAPGALGTLLGLPAWLLLHVIVGVVRFAAGIPGAALALPPELTLPAGVGALLLIVGTLLGLRHRASRSRRGSTVRDPHPRREPPGAAPGAGPTRGRPRLSAAERLAMAAAAIAIALSALGASSAAAGGDRLVMLDVGQGDAILVESRDGARMLVDGGPDPDRALSELDAVVPPWDRRIDLVVLTHPHEDHVAGLVRVLERYRVGRVLEPGMHGRGPGWSAWEAALRSGTPRATLAEGSHLRLGTIDLEVLWPPRGAVPTATGATGTAINATSIVLLGSVNGRRFLLTGDAEESVDPTLIAHPLPRLDVLKVAHHGSATATTGALLEAARPVVALISVGAGNDYGHPAPSTLGRLEAVGARVYRTDRDGRVQAELRPDGVQVSTAGARRGAAVLRTGYDRSHDGPPAPRGRPPAALARAARVVPPPCLRGGRRGRLARDARGGPRGGRGPGGGRGGRAPARRRQAARGRERPPPPWRGLRGVAVPP